MDDVTEALKKAKYNEIVQLTVSVPVDVDNDTQNNVDQEIQVQQVQEQVIALVSCLDEQHGGGIQWNQLQYCSSSSNTNVDSDDNDEESLILLQRHLQTKKWIFPMLNDTYRNELYYKAINAAIKHIIELKRSQKQKQQQKKQKKQQQQQFEQGNVVDTSSYDIIRIVDIGCGTGLLGMIAIQCLRQYGIDDTNIYVTAIDMSSEMIQIATQTIVDNTMDHIIHTQYGHSLVFDPLLNNNDQQNKYDLCVCELLEDGLLGEGIIPTINDAIHRYLHTDSIIIPSNCTVYTQLVTSSSLTATTTTTSATTNNTTTTTTQPPSSAPELSPCTTTATTTTIPNHFDTMTNSKTTAVSDIPASIVSTEWNIQSFNKHTINNMTFYDINKKNQYNISFDCNDNYSQNTIPTSTAISMTSQVTMRNNPACTVVPIHATKLINDNTIQLLSEPTQLFSISFQKPNNCSSILPTTSVISTKTTASNALTHTIEAVLVSWEVELYPGIETYTITPQCNSTSSLTQSHNKQQQQQPWQDHWHPCLHVLERPLTNISTNAIIQISAHYDDTAITITDVCVVPSYLKNDKNSNVNDPDHDETIESNTQNKRFKIENVTVEVLEHTQEQQQPATSLSSDRILQLSDTTKLQKWANAIEEAILVKKNITTTTATTDNTISYNDGIDSDVTISILDISDFSYCGMIAAILGGAEHIISIESSGNDSVVQSVASLIRNNQFPQHQQSLPKTKFEIIQCNTESLTNYEILGCTKPIDIVLGEPYYEILDGWHIQEALNHFYTIQWLHSNNVLAKDAIILPSSCRMMGCVIESTELRSAYSPCGTGNDNNIINLDHTFINKVGGNRFYTHQLVLPITSQYNYTILSEVVELMNLNFNNNNHKNNMSELTKPLTYTTSGQFVQGGTCDAILIWVEYDLTINSSMSSTTSTTKHRTLSTLSYQYKQCVQMMQHPLQTISDVDIVQMEHNNRNNNNNPYFTCTTRHGQLPGQRDIEFCVTINQDRRGAL